MKAVTLPVARISTTRLGMGCSDLLGGKTEREGLSLLAAAYESGIRHFDVARVYGFGDAERLVGTFAKNKRDQITLTTKFGLEPIRNVARIQGAVQAARGLMRRFTFVRSLVRRWSRRLVQESRFDPAAARASLEKSLRELQTDYVDIYLMHEAGVDQCNEALAQFLSAMQQQGKIRAFGLGTSLGGILPVIARSPEFTSVIQFGSSAAAPNVARVPRERPRAVITHGSFTAYHLLLKRFAVDPDFGARLTDSLNIAGPLQDALATMSLQWALRENSQGVVLFRSVDPKRIAQNARCAEDRGFSDEQLDRFERLVSEVRE